MALAGGRFERFAVENSDLAVMITDQSRASQLRGNLGDPGAANAEHRGQEFVGHWNVIGFEPGPRHQEPAGEPLLGRMEPIAGGGLSAEAQQAVGEAQRGSTHCRALVERCPACIGVHTLSGARYLDNDLLVRYVAAEKGGQSDDALGPDHPDLDTAPIRHTGQDGCYALLDEVDVFEWSAGGIDDLSQ